MSNNSKLLVPMFTEALVLRNDKADCLDLSPGFPGDGEEKILGSDMQPAINKKIKLKKGIHLHWTLPKELKHAFVDDGEEIKFPFVPNKWMVTRIVTDQGIDSIPSRSWIIESDSKSADQQKSNLVIINDVNIAALKSQQLEFVNVGKSTELKIGQGGQIPGFTPDAPAKAILKAVGLANPNFASFYPGCRNVFGFHDAMDDISTDCTLTYIIAGWYSLPAADPITPLDFAGEPVNDLQKKRKRELEWFRKKWKCKNNDDAYPSSSLLHSSIHSIKWDSQSRDGVPGGKVQVFVGNTSMEALSAQVSNNFSKKDDNIENLLNALQFGLLEDDLYSPSLASIKNEIHKRGFSPKNGGNFWEVTRVEADDKQLEEQEEKRLAFPNDLTLLNNLKSLNNLQAKLNKITLEILSLQQEYYFLWYKKAYQTTNNATVAGFDYDGSRTSTLNEINTRKGQAVLLSGQLENIKKLVSGHKDLTGENPEFELKQKLEDRFWEPNEPVVLLTGTGIGNTDKPDFDSGDKEVNCRTIDQVVSQLQLSVPYNPTPIPVTIPSGRFSVPKIDSLKNANIPFAEIQSLTHETLLFDQALSNEIALLAYKEANLDEGKTKDDPSITGYAKTVRTAQQNLLAGANISKQGDGQPPAAYAISQWTQAWSPLFMVWEAQYSPGVTQNNSDLLENTNSWKLEDGLFFKNQLPDTDNWNTKTFQGISPFSTAVFANLKRLLPAELVNQYGKLNLLAQTLGGFHKFLLMQRPEIQLPPLKYKPDKDYNISTDYIIDQDELGETGTAGYRLGSNPGDGSGNDPNQFFPLRSGLMQLVNLSLVDVFGQEKKVIVDKASNNITYTASVKGIDTTTGSIVPLPPRILQPSRLLFHWLNAKDEIIYQDAGTLETPVLGWVVPNYLDNSIMIYDGDGNDIAMLQIATDLSKAGGLNLIKMPFPGKQDIPDLTIINPHLKAFLDNLNKGSIASGLLDLALKINLNITGTNAVQINTTSLLCGQPLALARCSISLELMGLPAYNQRWDQSGKQNSGGIESVKIPLFIGDYSKEKDGLLGFFADDDYKALYTTRNAPDFNSSAAEPFFKPNTPVKISLTRDPVKMTFLTDPSAGVHISSGILPSKFVELFYHNSKELLSSLNISFMIAPFIAEKTGPGIPVPTSINANWKWTHKSDVTTWQKEADIPEGKNKQLSSFKKLQVYEGWLKLSNLKNK